MNKILLIIPHYNKITLLKECLIHLYEQTKIFFDIMIVDNGSVDGSPEYIFKESKKNNRIHYILLNENMGFAYAVNKGLKYSIDNSYEYSILLNNDAYVFNDFVEKIYSKIKSNNKYFAISALMIKYNDETLIDSFGDNYNIFGWAFQNKISEKISEINNDEYCFSACGGAAIYRNSVFNEIGLFDENFFAYLEDVDISYRAKIHGYSISTCKDAKCLHLGSATSGSKYNEFKVNISARNSIYLVYKNMPILQIILNLYPLIIGIFIKQIFFIMRGFGLDYFFGVVDGFKTIFSLERVKYNNKNLFNYIFIEIELIINTFKYIYNFIKRHT